MPNQYKRNEDDHVFTPSIERPAPSNPKIVAVESEVRQLRNEVSNLKRKLNRAISDIDTISNRIRAMTSKKPS